jgi:hypothetical protein
VRRRELAVAGGALLPLSLVEHARAGLAIHGPFRVFDPLAGELELLTLAGEAARAEPASAQFAAEERTLTLARADGSLAGRFRFVGHRLTEFAWHAGGLTARAVDEVEHERLRARAH